MDRMLNKVTKSGLSLAKSHVAPISTTYTKGDDYQLITFKLLFRDFEQNIFIETKGIAY